MQAISFGMIWFYLDKFASCYVEGASRKPRPSPQRPALGPLQEALPTMR
jgi:hypothetical protein